MSRYVQINYAEFKKLMDTMGCTEIQLEGTFERVWSFPIKNTNFDIRIYSTIDVSDNVSRRSGSDAIRCMIYDRKEEKILKLEKRVHRTESALVNTRERCRDLFRHVRAHKCSCGGVLVPRVSKHNHGFMGCTNFPKCKLTKNTITPQLKLKLKS
jgi:hypothetical protein